MYNYLQWELVCLFVLMSTWSKSSRVFLVMSVLQLAFGGGIIREVPEVVLRFLLMKCKHAQDRIDRTVDSRYKFLVLVIVFKASDPSINII